jgi:hypothetical protein
MTPSFFRMTYRASSWPPGVTGTLRLGNKSVTGMDAVDNLAGELWRFYFADISEVAIYCPECGEREFDDSRGR